LSDPDKRILRQKIMGALLSHARARAGRSQAEMAAALHVSRQRYSAYERGQQDVTVPELESIAHLCGVPLGYFFDDETGAEDSTTDSPVLISNRIRRRITGALLRIVRQKQNKTMEQCASVLGVSARRIGQYEMGETDIPPTELEALAGYLGAPADYFRC
jgi:transcriptional regulator with XRE-family HTH domain